MEEHFGLKFREAIAEIEMEPDFEKRGDALFLRHHDPEARMTWAFYRPSGSHQSQIEDPNPYVSIMAFNNSRLRPLERFAKLHKAVLNDEALRIRIAKRTRMLFRALADEDFIELVVAIKRYPFYIPLACDQVIHGRKMLEDVRADIPSTSHFLELTTDFHTKELFDAVCKKVAPLDELTLHEIKEILKKMLEAKEQLCIVFIEVFTDYIQSNLPNKHGLHPLQTKLLQRMLDQLNAQG